ncbi:MAG TPA: septum formation initiator family protein [Hyphomicrobiales bacterium]|nr:septum formation initiator family protein [Rhodobiaceae bacterium]HXK53581.1 septum formation initiator family protein [Hyphomicrobiales bacterium]
MSFQAHVKRAVFPLLCLALCGYFAYHAVEGDYGLLAWVKLSREQAELREELAEVRATRLALDHRVSLLRPESLDPDMLDERSRASVNLAHPDDITIMKSSR